MKVYIVFCSTRDEDNNVVKIFTDLDAANSYAKRSIRDDWRVQDGYEYQSVTRSDGTKCYTLESKSYDIYYHVESYDITEDKYETV
jgi:hypothetical protein